MEQGDALEEKEESTMRTWYAAVMDREDNDWGHGSYDLEEAKKMARKLGEGSLVIVIDDGNDPIAVDEIDPWENLTWKVYACGGDHDGEFVAEFENEALAINYCYEHENDYPLGHSIVDPDGNDVENW